MVPDFKEVSEQAFFASHFHEQPRNPRPKNLDESFGFRGIHHSRWSWTNSFTISTGLGHFWGFCTDIPPVYMFKPILLCCKRASFVCRTVKPSFLLVIFFLLGGDPHIFFLVGEISVLLRKIHSFRRGGNRFRSRFIECAVSLERRLPCRLRWWSWNLGSELSIIDYTLIIDYMIIV